MGIHIKRQDGMYLSGGGTMQVSDKPGAPYSNLIAACEAVNRYTFLAKLHNYIPEQYDTFIFEHIA